MENKRKLYLLDVCLSRGHMKLLLHIIIEETGMKHGVYVFIFRFRQQSIAHAFTKSLLTQSCYISVAMHMGVITNLALFRLVSQLELMKGQFKK